MRAVVVPCVEVGAEGIAVLMPPPQAEDMEVGPEFLFVADVEGDGLVVDDLTFVVEPVHRQLLHGLPSTDQGLPNVDEVVDEGSSFPVGRFLADVFQGAQGLPKCGDGLGAALGKHFFEPFGSKREVVRSQTETGGGDGVLVRLQARENAGGMQRAGLGEFGFTPSVEHGPGDVGGERGGESLYPVG